MSDSFSRQAAIDAAMKEVSDKRTHGFNAGATRAANNIKTLPSAEPEIIRCNSCKHWTQTIGEMRGFGLGICDFHNAKYVTQHGFCYWAERREE